ncbi:hypothetical protein pb186bvf_008567 [Paramecium bursaria]
MIYRADHFEFPIYFPAIFINLFTFFWFLLQLRLTVKYSKQTIALVFIGIRFLLVTQCTIICLKTQLIIDWNWFYVLAIFWLIGAVFLILQICFLIDLLFKAAQMLQENDVDSKEQLTLMIIGSLWINITILSITGVPLLTILSYCLKIEFNVGGIYIFILIQPKTYYYRLQFSHSYFMCYLCFNSCHLLVILQIKLMVFVRIKFHNSAFIQTFTENKTNISDQDSNHPIQSPQSRVKQSIFPVLTPEKQMIISKIPAVLLKLSSTYFLPDLSDQKRHKTEQKQQNKVKSSMTDMNDRQRDAESMCFNCCQGEQQAVCMPCGHGGMCIKCALDWFQQKPDCLICRQPVESIVQVCPDLDHNKVRVVDIIAIQS